MGERTMVEYKRPDGSLMEGAEILRAPFPENQISKLPKPTKQQTDEVRNNYKAGIRCDVCGGWHHPKVIHLDYVGHAALTDRLLDADPAWNWEPVAFSQDGNPLLVNGGLWIRLTVGGVTRLGYGDAQDKQGHNAIKEAIGDALRNAAMRFGAALDLWHKGDLHDISQASGLDQEEKIKTTRTKTAVAKDFKSLVFSITKTGTMNELKSTWEASGDFIKELKSEWPENYEALLAEKDKHKERLSKTPEPETVDIENQCQTFINQIAKTTTEQACKDVYKEAVNILMKNKADNELIRELEEAKDVQLQDLAK